MTRALEHLEPRRLFAVGELDPAFGVGGVALTNAIRRFEDDHGMLVPMPDGRTVSLGRKQDQADNPQSWGVLIRRLSDGTLDPTFGGGDGIVQVDELPTWRDFAPAYAALQPDGGLLVMGRAFDPGSEARVIRLTPQGERDDSFDGAAIVAAMRTRSHFAQQPDGKLILLRSDTFTFNPENDRGLLYRFNIDGSIDTNFGGGDGVADVIPRGESIHVGSDGRILVVSGSIGRYNADGSVDTSFGGGDGVVEVESDWFPSAAPAPDGGVYVATLVDNVKVSFRKLTASGVVDSTFAPHLFDVYKPWFLSTDIDVQSDGKIVVLVHDALVDTTPEERIDPIVARFNPGGTPDATFGAGGFSRVLTGVHGGSELFDLHLTPDGIYGIGRADERMILVRLADETNVPATIGIEVIDRTLTIVGTGGRDAISLETNGSNVDVIAGGVLRSVPAADFDRILITGSGGDDGIDLGQVSPIGGGDAFFVTIDGGDGDDVIVGSAGRDRITGGLGDDRIDGREGNDDISGNAQTDRIDGGRGDDVIRGNGGRDILHGFDGNDTVQGGDQPDVVSGGVGDDVVEGQGGHDIVVGDGGQDLLTGGGGNDRFFADDDQRDTIVGGIAGLDEAEVDELDEVDAIETLL